MRFPSVKRWYSEPLLTASASRRPNSFCRNFMMPRTRCRGKPLRRRAQITAISVTSSKVYSRRRPSRCGCTMPRSSHHWSCRGVIPVSLTTCADVKRWSITTKKCFKHFLIQMFASFYGQNQECQWEISREVLQNGGSGKVERDQEENEAVDIQNVMEGEGEDRGLEKRRRNGVAIGGTKGE